MRRPKLSVPKAVQTLEEIRTHPPHELSAPGSADFKKGEL
jgi:hypothetical protein